jgi:hypothetical protein
MKNFFVFAILVIAMSLNIFSQEQTQKHLSVGPYFAFKGGVNGSNVQEGRKNAISIYPVPDFGATAFLPLIEDYSLAVSCDVGYSAYSYSLKDGSLGTKYDFHYGYLSLSPNFYFLYFFLGFNFGYPLHADFGETIDTKDLNIMAEFRVGVTYPLIYDESVSMNIFANAGYMLTGIYKNYQKGDPLKVLVPNIPPDFTTEAYNPRPVSFSIGLNYLFTINY